VGGGGRGELEGGAGGGWLLRLCWEGGCYLFLGSMGEATKIQCDVECILQDEFEEPRRIVQKITQLGEVVDGLSRILIERLQRDPENLSWLSSIEDDVQKMIDGLTVVSNAAST
jgi:hypothetical protein